MLRPKQTNKPLASKGKKKNTREKFDAFGDTKENDPYLFAECENKKKEK